MMATLIDRFNRSKSFPKTFRPKRLAGSHLDRKSFVGQIGGSQSTAAGRSVPQKSLPD